MKAAALLCVIFIVAICQAANPDAKAQQTVTDLHNTLRANVNPPAATPLQPLVYDSGAQSVASNYADQCNYAHNANRGNYGENIYASAGYTGDDAFFLKAASDSWESEKVDYTLTATSGTCASGKVCGHYTQQAWANTGKIGCGIAYCTRNSPFGGFPSWTFVVCNYAVPGNYNGQLPYQPGTGSAPAPATPTRTPAAASASNTRTAAAASASSTRAPASATRTPTRLAASASRTPSRNQAPATPTPSPSASRCVNTCPAGFCGQRVACGTTINCGCGSNQFCNNNVCTTCATACNGNNCGQIFNTQCNNYEACSCSNTGLGCTNNVCTAPACNVAQSCSAAGWNCGTQSVCGTTASCGTCSASQTCSSGRCVSAPCGGACGTSEVCNTGSNRCECASGFTRNSGGVCVANPVGGLDFTQDFRTLFGLQITYPEPAILTVQGSPVAETVVSWEDTKGTINPYYTEIEFDVTANSGRFGIVYYLDQSQAFGASGKDDGIYMYVDGIGTSRTSMNLMLRYQNQVIGPYNFGSYPWQRNAPNHIDTVLGVQDDGSILITWYFPNGYYQASSSPFPGIGNFGFNFLPTTTGSPYVQNVVMYTTTTITVTLVECIDTDTWEAQFLAATNAPVGTSVTILNTQGNGLANCAKMAGVGKEVASAFTFAVTSTAINSQAIATTFVQAVETSSASVAGLGVSSAAVVPGVAGAELAGAPVASASTVLISSSGVIAGGAGAGAGGAAGGGGAGGGLSGGAIAGIVVGSVAGGVLALGLTAAVIVAVVVVAAVLIAKSRDSDDNDSPAPSRAEGDNNRRSMRQTVYNLFGGRPKGGVDVMNGSNKGHQSITARAPAHPMR